MTFGNSGRRKRPLTVAFDVDDTLIVADKNGVDGPNHNVIDLLRWYQRNGHTIWVWSGGGVPYATRWAERLHLGEVTILAKGSEQADIAVDDFGFNDLGQWMSEADSTALGKVLIRV